MKILTIYFVNLTDCFSFILAKFEYVMRFANREYFVKGTAWHID